MKEDQKALVLARRQNALAFGDIHTLAQSAARSGYFGRMTQEQALIAALMGQEHGIPPATSLSMIHIIEGKPTLSAGALAALLKASGRYRYKVERWDNEGCVLRFYERVDGVWEEAGPSTFTLADADRAEVSKNKNWQRYPRNMLFARALSNGCRIYAPEIAAGLYTPEELGAEVNEEGNVIEAEIVTSPPQQIPYDDRHNQPPPPDPAPAFTETPPEIIEEEEVPAENIPGCDQPRKRTVATNTDPYGPAWMEARNLWPHMDTETRRRHVHLLTGTSSLTEIPAVVANRLPQFLLLAREVTEIMTLDALAGVWGTYQSEIKALPKRLQLQITRLKDLRKEEIQRKAAPKDLPTITPEKAAEIEAAADRALARVHEMSERRLNAAEVVDE